MVFKEMINGEDEHGEYFNVKRALGIDCGKDEIEIGVSEVRETMKHIIYYNGIKDKILENLHK